MTLSPGRATLLGTVKEADWQRQVVAWAKRAGWHVHFVWDSRHSPDGWPDLFCVRGDRMLALECKTQKGRTTDAQDEWLAWLNAAGVDGWVVRPSDEDLVRRTLA